jgi:ArsR family transcriptional regulator
MKEFLKVMKAASDPSRAKILKMLQSRVMCVCEVHSALGTAQSTASKHLKILEDAGLANLLGNIKHWLNEESEIVELIEKLPTVRREEICKG